MLEQLNRIRPLFSRRDKFLYIGLFFLMCGSAALEVIGVGAVPSFIATLSVPEKVMAYPHVRPVLEALNITTPQSLALWACAALVVVFVLKNAYVIAAYNLMVRVTEYHRVRLSTRLFRAYMSAPYEFYLQRNSAELLRNVQTETNEIVTGVINPLIRLVLNVLTTVGIIALVVVASPSEVLLGMAIVVMGSWGVLRLTKKRMKEYGRIAKEERKESIRAVNQGLGGFLDARILGREKWFNDAYEKSTSEFARVSRMKGVIAQASPNIIELLALSGLLIVVVGLLAAQTPFEAIVPILALFGTSVFRLRSSVSAIVSIINQMQFSTAALPVVLDDLNALEKPDWEKQKEEKRQRGVIVRLKDAIEIEHLTYRYPGTHRAALQDVNLRIPKGTSVGFVGATGSGKTTLVNVLLGLYRPQQGRVVVDGRDIHDNLRTWLDNVGYIPQTIYLLDDTIRRNVAFGLSDAEIEDEKVRRAMDAAQLSDFVDSLPGGLDTVVGERGVRLSGGQRQRIGLARALYHDPEIILMDEATSALDNKTESLVMQALETLKEGRTFIMIAHRLSTVRKCDTLYFLRNGEVEASGTYDELTLTHAEFREMAEVA